MTVEVDTTQPGWLLSPTQRAVISERSPGDQILPFGGISTRYQTSVEAVAA